MDTTTEKDNNFVFFAIFIVGWWRQMIFLAMDNLAGDMNRMGKLFLRFTTLVTCGGDTDIYVRCKKQWIDSLTPKESFKMRHI